MGRVIAADERFQSTVDKAQRDADFWAERVVARPHWSYAQDMAARTAERLDEVTRRFGAQHAS